MKFNDSKSGSSAKAVKAQGRASMASPVQREDSANRAQPVQREDWASPAQQAQQSRPADPAQRVDPANQAQLVQQALEASPVQQALEASPALRAQQAGPAQQAQRPSPAHRAAPAGPADPAQREDQAQRANPAQRVDPVNQAQLAQQAQQAGPAHRAAPASPANAGPATLTRRAFALSLAAACVGAAGCSSSTDSTDSSSSTGSTTETSDDGTTAITNELETVVCEPGTDGEDWEETVSWVRANVYDVDAQAELAQELESQKDGQTLAAPLIVYNPFGTYSQGLYVYFTTDEAATVSYTVSVSDDEAATIEDETFTAGTIADFTRSVNDGESATEFEFVLLGLIPNVENTVSITAAYEDGSTETTTFACEMCDVLGNEQLQLEVTEGESASELADGLYTLLGEDSEEADFVYLYDNDGILRGELPVADSRSHRFIFEDDLMYFSISKIRLAAMNSVGQIVQDYNVQENVEGDENYQLHHDYTSDGGDHLIVLASDLDEDTVEDYILFVNKGTGEIDSVINMGDVMPDYKEQALAYHYANVDADEESANFDGEEGVDWLHINGVQWMGDDSILLSSRETSSIIKLSDVYGTPTLEYLISSADYWEGTGYEDYVLTQVGDFTVQGGQHCIEYVEDDSLDAGQYYVNMFNNNIGISGGTTSDFDYASIGLTNTAGRTDEDGVYSYYYKYLVDENEGTFELVQSIAVPYSGYISSVQDVDGNVVADSGLLGIFGEYDADGALIRQFTVDIEDVLYRVFKYDL